MVTVWEILNYIKLSLFPLIIIANIIYCIPIIFIRRFHIRYNILTMNMSLASMSCAMYWAAYTVVLQIDFRFLFKDSTCPVLLYMQLMVIFQASYSIILISINQFCDIIYFTNRFFKTKKWLIICIASQWIAGFILSIPGYSRNPWVRFCYNSVHRTMFEHFLMKIRALQE